MGEGKSPYLSAEIIYRSIYDLCFRTAFDVVVIVGGIAVLQHGMVTTFAAYRLLGIQFLVDEILKNSPCVRVFVCVQRFPERVVVVYISKRDNP